MGISVVSIGLLITTVFGPMAEGLTSSPSGQGVASGDASGPRSAWDFQIHDRTNETFPKYAEGQGFSAFFADGATATDVLRLEDSFSDVIQVGLRATSNGSVALAQVNGSRGTAAGTSDAFADVWGSGSNLSYKVGPSGVKETATFQSRPGTGDLLVNSVVAFDQNKLTPEVKGSAFSGYMHWSGDVVFVNGTGVERFRIPQAFVVDSGAGHGRDEHFLRLEYQLNRVGSSLSISAVVPSAYLDNSSLTWPIVVDPTLVVPPQVSGSLSCSYADVFMESSLLILPSSSLSLDHCSMYFNGNYQLEVSPSGTLNLNASQVRSNSSAYHYGFYTNGSLLATNSSILDTNDGVRIASSETTTIQGSLIANGTGDGLALLTSPYSFLFNQSAISNVSAAAIRVDIGAPSAAPFTNVRIAGAGDGIWVANTTLSGIQSPIPYLAFDNFTMQDLSDAAVTLDHATTALSRIVINSAAVGLSSQNSSLSVTSSTIVGVTSGTTCTDGSVFLDEVVIYRISGVGHNAINCAAVWVDGNYYSWSRSLAASSIEVRHRLNTLVVNATDVPLAFTAVSFYRPDGQLDGGAATAANGWLNGTILKEFLLGTNGAYTFYTPHRIQITAAGTPTVHYYVGGKGSITIHATNDADADGIPNTQEDDWQNVTWLEAEYKMKADGQSYSQFVASGETAVQAAANGSYFTDMGWPVYGAGTYQVLLKAAGNGLGATMNVSVVNATGSTLLSGEDHNLTTSYAFVTTKSFTIASNQSLVVRVNSTVPSNSTFMIGAAVLIDKLAIVRLKNSTNQPLPYPSGAFSDPMDNDTDFDGLKDGSESTPARGWYEAEVLAPAAPEYPSSLASSGLSVIHPGGTPQVLNVPLSGYVAHTAGPYQLYVRAISLTGSSVNVTLQISGMGPPAVGTVKAGADWAWLAGPVLTAGVGPGLLFVTVTDADDLNYNDSGGYVAIDEVAMFDAGSLSNQPGWFNASSPLDPDADRDGLNDGAELNGFFTADMLQAENYSNAQGVGPYRFGIVFNSSASWANYSIDVRYAGEYRFLIEPMFEVSDGAGAMPYDTLQNLLDAQVRDANQNPVAAIGGGLAAFNYSNYPSNENDMSQVGSFFDGRFNLTVGNYTVKLTINVTKAGSLAAGGRSFRLFFDRFYLQKFRLNATDWDADHDGVPDGYEVNQSMLPLRVDSDYDTLSDFEEIHLGMDGYITSPISNDTDRDGVLDPVEVGGVGDTDNSTRTDPTNPDTDGDGLPDGWVDGWTWNLAEKRYAYLPAAADGLRQPWEGEDLNGDGAVGGGAFQRGNFSTSVGGETDPNSPDTDGDTMRDGWEVLPRNHYGDIEMLDPLSNDSAEDVDSDGLANFGEFVAGTDPFQPDSDSDGINDGPEARVFFRTNVTAGASNTTFYGGAVSSSWIYYHPNPYDLGTTGVYQFQGVLANQSADSSFSPNWTTWLKVLSDGGLVVYNGTLDEVVVWAFDSDPFDANHDDVLEGKAYAFVRNESLSAVTGGDPAYGFWGRELIGPVDPTNPDSDGDGVPDGNEGYSQQWWADYDGDGRSAAADTDSDGDGIPDGREDLNDDGVFDAAQGETAAFAADTDGDGVADGNDTLPLDLDNDGLTGFLYHHDGTNWYINDFGGVEALDHTSPTSPDTDRDGLKDGQEDANHDGVLDLGETNASDADTDNDGLCDGPLVRNNASNITVPVQNWIAEHNVTGVMLGGQAVALFQEPAWYVDELNATYTLANLTFTQYLVTANLTEYGPAANTTRLMHIRVDGVAWWASQVVLSTSAPNWTTAVLGHILVPPGSSHNLTFASDRGGFYLGSLTLTPVNLSEQWFGTDPLRRDSDADGLGDGAEVGLNNTTVTGNCGNQYATDTCAYFQPNLNGFWSDPMKQDTDGDGLHDGEYTVNNTSYGEAHYHTDPASNDTDRDHLSDWVEVFKVGSDPTMNDTDGDGLPDSYEPIPGSNVDGDTYAAVRDADTDNNGSDLQHSPYVNDYVSSEPMGGWNAMLTAVFRTNATRQEFWRPGTWVAVNVSHASTLDAFVFDANVTNLAGYAPVLFQTHVRADGDTGPSQAWYNHSVTTFDGLAVLSNGTDVVIRINSGFGYGFRPWGQGDGALPPVDPRPTLQNEPPSSFIYRETINWSAIFYLQADIDGDGLNAAGEAAAHTNVSDPDTDHDGLTDGQEVYTYKSNATNNDTDGDGLTDGVEVYGWPNGWTSDPTQVDTDKDGAWDGDNTTGPEGMPGQTTFNLGEWRNGTNPREQDTDGDGIPDGWELTYGLSASDPMDSVSDPDYDLADNWQEYYWGRNETNDSWDGNNDTWNESLQGVWWNGTNPLRLDSEGDGMPDGWEMAFGLDPLVNDSAGDPDQDGLTNRQEYNWSIVDPSWNQSRAWDFELSADPHNNDTDRDGMTDYTELVNRTKADFDHDGIPSAVDQDSDEDGLPDSIEVSGWRVGVANVSQTRAFLISVGHASSSDFYWYNVTSDPFNVDTDQDGVGDAGEFANFSDPRSNDTDQDFVNDSADKVQNPKTGNWTSTSVMQDIQGPEIYVLLVTDGDCPGSIGKFSIKVACTKISFSVLDPNRVKNLTFTHLGLGLVQTYENNLLGMRMDTGGSGNSVSGWILMPLKSASEYEGQYKILISANDGLGNPSSQLVLGGNTYNKWKGYVNNVNTATFDEMRTGITPASCAAAQLITGVTPAVEAALCVAEKARDFGYHYGFDIAAHDGGAWIRDPFSGDGAVSVTTAPPPACDLACEFAKAEDRAGALVNWTHDHQGACAIEHTNGVDIDAWLEFVQSEGPSLDPFPPTYEDQVNLSTEPGQITLYCQGERDPANASYFTLWLKAFYDGSRDGGAGYGLLMFAVNIVTMLPMLPFAAIGEALTGLLEATAEEAVAEGASEATVVATEAVAKGGIEAATAEGLSTTAEATSASRAVAGQAGEVLEKEGGSLPQAVRAEEGLAEDVGAEAADGAAHTTQELEETARALDDSGQEALKAELRDRFADLQPPPSEAAYKAAAENGIRNNFARFAARFDNPAFQNDVKGFVQQMKDAGFGQADIDEAFGMRSPNQLKQFLGERGMVAKGGVDRGLVDVERTATGRDLSAIGGKGRAYVDAVVHTDPPQIWEAKFYNWENFQAKFQSLWKSENTGGSQIQKLLRDRELYSATDDVQGTANRVFYVRADTYDAFKEAVGETKAIGAFKNIGWTIERLPEFDVPQAGRALGIAGVA